MSDPIIPPILLALESSGDVGGAAILRGGQVLAEASISQARAHGAELVPCIDRALKDAGLGRSDLRVVVANEGPGSYTGLRVAHAAAELIGLALNIPALGVPCLEAMCEEAIARAAIPAGIEYLLPALDARREEFVCARFALTRDASGAIIGYARETEDQVIPPDAIPGLAPRGGLIFGDALASYGESLIDVARGLDGSLLLGASELSISAASVGRAALRLHAESMTRLGELERGRIVLRYFRPVLAQTVAERQAIAEAKARARGG